MSHINRLELWKSSFWLKGRKNCALVRLHFIVDTPFLFLLCKTHRSSRKHSNSSDGSGSSGQANAQKHGETQAEAPRLKSCPVSPGNIQCLLSDYSLVFFWSWGFFQVENNRVTRIWAPHLFEEARNFMLLRKLKFLTLVQCLLWEVPFHPLSSGNVPSFLKEEAFNSRLDWNNI